MLKSNHGKLRRHLFMRIVLWSGIAATLASVAHAADLHKWTDATGEFSIDAQFVSEQGGKVTLRTADGNELEIALDKLSKADQDYVSKQKSDNPFKPKSKNPFQPRSAPSTPMKEDSAAGPAPGGVIDDTGRFESRLIDVDASGAKVVLSLFESAEWQLSPEPGASEAIHGKGKPFSLPPKKTFHEKGTNLVFARSGKHALIGYKLDFPADQQITRLVLCDLKTGRVVADLETGGLLKPLALSDDGSTVAMVSDEFGLGKHDRLEIWTISRSAIRKGSAWLPHGRDKDVDWAFFLPDGTLLSAGDEAVIAWNISSLDALWTAPLARYCTPAVSPDGHYIVLATNDQLSVIDARNQETVASQAPPAGGFLNFSFSDSGKRFACASSTGMTVWETATGEIYRDMDLIGFPPIDNRVAPMFSGDETLLLGNTVLVDLPSLIPLWQYTRQLLTAGHAGLCWFVAADGDKKPGVLFGADLPHPPVVDALAKAQADPNFFIVKPGASIKLNLNAVSDQRSRNELRTSLVERLKENEMTIAESAPVELVVSYDPPKEINVAFRGFGGTQSVDFKETISRIKLLYEGQTLWESKASNRPHFVQIKKGESLQEAVSTHEKRGTTFFERVKIPRLLARPNGTNSATLGQSTVTTTGIH